MQRHAYDFPYVVQTFESPRPGGEEQWTARVAFGYSPLFGCFLLTSPPVLLEKDTVALRLVSRFFHQWKVSPILCCSSREGTVHLRRGLHPLRYQGP